MRTTVFLILETVTMWCQNCNKPRFEMPHPSGEGTVFGRFLVPLEPRDLKPSFGGGESRTEGESKHRAISDFEMIHPNKNIFYRSEPPRNQFLQDLGFDGFDDFASPRSRISRFFEAKFREFENLYEILRISRISEDLQSIWAGR